MTHTEESLMALAQACTVAAAKSPYLGETHYTESVDALRLAIREVLAERDALKQSEYERVSLANGIDDLLLRAERAEAERDALRKMQEHCLLGMKHCPQRSRAEKAEAECAALETQLKLKPAPMADCPVYCKTAVDLQAECGRLRSDAERYRWLRSEECNMAGDHTPLIAAHNGLDAPILLGGEADAAIDAAMKETP